MHDQDRLRNTTPPESIEQPKKRVQIKPVLVAMGEKGALKKFLYRVAITMCRAEKMWSLVEWCVDHVFIVEEACKTALRMPII